MGHRRASSGSYESGKELIIRTSPGHMDNLVEKWRRIPLDVPVPIVECLRTREIVACGTMEEWKSRYPA